MYLKIIIYVINIIIIIIIGVEHEEDHPGVKKSLPTFGKNVWPEKIDNFREKFELYWQKLDLIAQALL